MPTNLKIASLVQISNFLEKFLENDTAQFPALSENLVQAMKLSEQTNSWFTQEFQRYALGYWKDHLKEKPLENWLTKYSFKESSKRVGLVLAGNIPMVGFHDVLCVLLSGNKAQIKLSSKDAYLIPFLLDFWKSIEPSIEYELVENLQNYDAVIATGSNNTARYFETYFKDKPHIIRKNRTSMAVLSGNETLEDLQGLADDIFIYFGLGCRNVTQLFVPKGFDLNRLFEAFLKYQHLANHNKYLNSYEYYRALYMLNKDTFWDNNFVLLKNSDALFAPVATVNFKEYEKLKEVENYIELEAEHIQAVVSNSSDLKNVVPIGSAQQPSSDSYADGVDVMQFLETI